MDNRALLEREVALCRLEDLQEMQAIELSIEERKLFAIRRDNSSTPTGTAALTWVFR